MASYLSSPFWPACETKSGLVVASVTRPVLEYLSTVSISPESIESVVTSEVLQANVSLEGGNSRLSSKGGNRGAYNSPARDSRAERRNSVVACDALFTLFRPPALAVEKAIVDDVETRHTAESKREQVEYTMMVSHQPSVPTIPVRKTL